MFYSSINKKNKESLIFLHGWGGSWQSWYPILEALKNEFNLYALDLPGFGNQKIEIPYHLDNYVDFIINFIKKNKVKNPILIGHSFGGAIVAKIAADQSIPIKKIILVDAAIIRHPYSLKQEIIIKTVSSVKKILSIPPVHFLLPKIQKIYYKSTGFETSDYAALKNNPILQKTFQNVIKHDLSKILHRIKASCLLIWGENDLETPLADGQRINFLIPKSKIIIYPHSSHFSYLENQDLFLQDIKKFIQK
ncbi:MAG: alpha/beta hydrolase [Candidatus Shapirobacteria bacterium]|nr:alpha/beta hydrolase [Candidatus Shapirobacteria bacterium]